MQINSINNYDFKNRYNKANNHAPSFEGFGIKALMPASKKVRSERVQEMIDDACWRYSSIIGIRTSELQKLTQNANEMKMRFLKTLVTNYNGRNYTRAGNLKENPQGVIDVFNAVKKPQIAHFGIVRETDAPLGLLTKLFEKATDKESLEFVQNVQHDVLGGKKEAIKIITDMLSSKNKREYIKNIGNYVSYLKQNIQNENAVKELDQMLENGTYNRQIYDAKQAVQTMMRNHALRATLGNNEKYLEQNYSREGQQFMDTMFNDFLAHKKDLKPEDFSDILKMYKSASAENIKTRLEILNRFKYATANKTISASQEIKSMKKLFDRMDSDKTSANFVVKVLNDDIKAKSIKDLAGILDIVPASKAEIFHKNISRIVRFTDEEERASALKNQVENPFFMTDKYAQILEDSINAGFSKKESRISKMARFLENKYNQMKYHRIENSQTSSSGIGIHSAKPEITVPVQTPSYSTAVAETKTPAIELKRTFKESPQARKLRVQNDVNEIIKQKLGAKTLERQQEAYKNGALVMRLKLLPEIFESIKDTRKVQHAAGIRPNVKSADAVKLYSRINGKNRKLVNYMLKQTNDKGERIFTVKDIIKQLDKVEYEIKQAKIRNTNFKTSEVKEIYNDEFGYLQYEFGKLKKRRKIA